MLIVAIFFALLTLSSNIQALELTHRNFIYGALRQHQWSPFPIDTPFFSEFEIKKEINYFSGNSGFPIVNAPTKVVSAYDATSTVYELTQFYTAEKEKVHLIINYFLPKTNILISFGFDSGSSAEKIYVSPTRFIGISTHKSINSKSAIYFMAGGWQREKITEKPCVDNYGREYWCPNLTSWSEHVQPASNPLRFIDFKYELLF